MPNVQLGNKIKFGIYLIALIFLVNIFRRLAQYMANRLVDTGRKCGMGINIDKSQVMRVSRSNESMQIKVNNRELK
jgi:hypothetical protein